MLLDLLPVFFGVVLAQASPGPNMMAVAAAAFGPGRPAALAVALGVATGVFLWAILFAFGMSAVIAAFPATLIVMKLVGGSYLLYLGLRAARQLRAGGSLNVTASDRAGLRAAYLRGLLVVMTNPKAALMWVAVSMYLAGLSLGPVATLLVGGAVSLTAALIYGTYALLFSTGLALRGVRRVAPAINFGFATVFGALGAQLLLSGARDLR